MRRRILLVVGLATVAGVLGCSSPEATRTRGGGPGADVGNRRDILLMHEGSLPFHETPSIVKAGPPDLEPARQAARLSTRE
jgi:hypothetical protein